MEIAKSLQQIQSSYIREILDAASDPNVISLAGGLPDAKTFPIELMRETLSQLADMPEVFQYGNTAGYGPLLDYLSGYFSLPENQKALISTGSQQGLDLVARAFIDPGDKVVMEAPSYLGAMQVFGLVQADIVTVPQNESGPELDKLETCFKEEKPKLFYTVPDFHNPTGVCWSLEARQKVAELCEKYGVTLVEDSPYRELRFTGEALPLASSFCPDNSIVLRSFSKIASPGLRMGVVTGKASYIDPMIKVKQGADLHSSVPMQALLLGLLKHDNFELHIDNIRELYKSRCEKLISELKDKLPQGCTVNNVEGGMFVWVTIPECDTFKLAKELLAEGVAIVPSDVFYPQNAEKQAAMRLNFSNATPDEIEIAVDKLAKVLKDFH
ncbi:PLP-dependent aminotransferase family protein [Vibrio sp. JC009]|uniref:aminotransferase-like domain-containing protein n=1 Tax=Vibrio sp. JC009 TaxID=2912314 RepID=UPI0023AEF763|nr:PLP-dependent aminotransferase family protein [Vibrio sp. JC009]WED22906.1 PLP-dependent aminotransferase family protein [Vibrio sp. JC009]